APPRVWPSEIEATAKAEKIIADVIRTLFLSSLSENRQVEGIRHSLIAGIIRMNMIDGIEVGANVHRALRIPNHGIEVHDRIESFTRSNPLIHRCPNLLASFGRSGHAFLRHDRRTGHFDPGGVCTLNKLAVSGNQFIARKRVGTGASPADIDVVDPFQQNHPYPRAKHRSRRAYER